MIYYISTALISYMVGACTMRTLQKFFHKEVKKRITSEKRVFKQDGYGFYVKKMEDGTIEWWAHWNEKCESMYGDNFFLGTWTEEDGFVPVGEYRQLRHWLQKGAERMRRYMLGKNYGLYDMD